MLFPTICVDNFLDDPHKLIEFSKKCNYTNDGYVFGERTDSLNNINNEMFLWINRKLLSILYPYNYTSMNFRSFTCFQKSYPSEADGWVHVDTPNLITSILYLTEEGTVGTSLYKGEEKNYYLDQSKKFEYFKNKSPEHYKEVLKAKNKNNKLFTKTLHFDGLFNRLIMFDSSNPHASEVLKENKNRLILISFFEEINQNMKYPIPTYKKI